MVRPWLGWRPAWRALLEGGDLGFERPFLGRPFRGPVFRFRILIGLRPVKRLRRDLRLRTRRAFLPKDCVNGVALRLRRRRTGPRPRRVPKAWPRGL